VSNTSKATGGKAQRPGDGAKRVAANGRSDPKPASAPAALDPAAGGNGRNLRRAIRLLYAEAVVVGLVALLAIWLAVAADNVSVPSAIATAAFAVLFAAILAGLAAALAHRKSLARGPAILVQMLLVPVGGYMIVGGIPWLGIPVLVAGLFGSGFLLAPSTRMALGLDRTPF
jgi:hypothetical protein